MVAPLADLQAALTAMGADGWWFITTFTIQFQQRRMLFMNVGGVVEYLVGEADTGRSAADTEAVLDARGADGWQLIQIFDIKKDRRRAIYARGGAGGGGGNGSLSGTTIVRTFDYKFDSSTAPPVSSGEVELDNSDPTLAATVNIANQDGAGVDVSNYLGSLLVGDTIYLQVKNNASIYFRYRLTATPTAGTGYFSFPVNFELAGSTTNFKNNDPLVVSMGTGAGEVGVGGGGGIGEAPTDGVTYGRQLSAWNPALALNNDTLDGGNF